MELLRVTYRLEGDPSEALARAEAIALEQTVEVPRAVAMREPFIAREIVGRVESVEPAADGSARAVIAYPVAATALDPAQLLGVLFGNTSLQADVQCVDFRSPALAVQGSARPARGRGRAARAHGRAGIERSRAPR
jgi:ribulose-bisphosphate carboxylase large chain